MTYPNNQTKNCQSRPAAKIASAHIAQASFFRLYRISEKAREPVRTLAHIATGSRLDRAEWVSERGTVFVASVGALSCVQLWMKGSRKRRKSAARSCRAMHVCASGINSAMPGRASSSTRRPRNYRSGQAARFARPLTNYPVSASLRHCRSLRFSLNAALNDKSQKRVAA